MKIDGRKIRIIREKKGISRTALSAQSNVPVRTLQDWETGRRNPRNFDIVESVLRALNIRASDIYSDEYLSFLNKAALVNSDEIQNETPEGIALIQKIEDIFQQQDINGLLRILDRFIYHIGPTEALKILEEYENEGC